ncbi:MAG: hypothetical protein J6D37_03550 [Clostridia bacterium]|nr:hypothetical protein [Clostridia bacterium]
MSLREFYWKLRKQYYKAKMMREEKSFGESYPLKYFLQRDRRSSDLIVVYSAFPETGKPASYHYVTTLSKIKANKLFLLDEYGPEGRGCYYLGEKGNFAVERNVKALLKKLKEELSIRRTVHVGSSKGGYAALYFGLDEGKDTIVAGGAQYFLGQYTLRHMPPLYSFLTGEEPSKKGIKRLDSLLKDKLAGSEKRKIYLHYSDAEHTYEDSMRPLIADLKENGFAVEEDVAHYTDHGEIGLYFAEYLPQILSRILKEES